MTSAPTSPHTTLQFLGAADTVTGSKYLVTVGERRLLIDFGMFQGRSEWRKRNWLEFPFDPRGISDVLITHAHMDHVGMLPRLVKEGYRGPIFCTEGTRQLAEIVLRDGAKIQEQDANDANEGGYSKHHPAMPLYTTADVELTLPLFITIPYDEDIDLDDGIIARYTRAGHILGSASITMWTPTASVLFSGDLGRKDHQVLKPRETPPGASVALIESTYGNRDHPDDVNLPHEGFADVIRRTIARGGSVIVPAFAVDRTEVVLKTLADMRKHDRIPHVPVYVDSPMANAALDVYRSATDELREDLRPEDFVEFPDMHEARTPDESRALTRSGGHGPAIIISASGMATGGRVLHHLEQKLPDDRNAVVLTGYQAEGTRGRLLADGAKRIKMRGHYVPVRAEIYQDRAFSVHADRRDLLDWLRELDPRPSIVFCTHGEAEAQNALAELIEREFPRIDAIVPGHGEVVNLDGIDAVDVAAPTDVRKIDRHVDVAAAVPEPTPLDYRLATGATAAELATAVTGYLTQGFELYGNPGVGSIDGETVYLQALIAPGARA